MWSSYRDHTSPHYLLFYIAIFLFAYLVIIKREWRWLDDVFDIQPAVSDDTVLPKDALSLPGSYHTLFSLSYVTNINAELEKARENAKDVWDSMAVSCELLEKEFEEELRKASEHGVDIDSLRKEIDFLKRDLKAARGLEEHQQDQLHKFQRAMVNERSRHQRELAATRAELSAIKNHSSSPEATRHPGSVAKKGADNALLRDQLRIAEREIKRLRYGGSSATDSGQSVLRNRQLLTNNTKLMEDLELAREQVASCEMAHKRTLSQLQEAEKELRPTNAAVNSIKLELERAQKELKAAQYGPETTAVVSQEALNKRESRDTVLLGQVKELLKFQNKSASTIQNLNAELQQVKLALASALAESSNREREFEQANNDLALQKQSVEDTLNETLRQLKDVKDQLATAPLQQSSNYNDAVHQLNNTTDELQNVRQQLVNMTHQLNKKESDRQYARRQWQEHCGHIQWLYQNWASREKDGKVLAEVQHLKQNGVSKEDYENARAEIVDLKDKIVSLQRPNAAELTSGGNLAEQLPAKKHEFEKAHHQRSALHAMNRRLDGQKAVSPNSGSNEVAILKEKINVLQEHVAPVPELHKKNKELLSQLQIARDKHAGPPEIASLQRSLDREHRRATDLKDELEAKARELEQERVKHKHM